jgi:hypothetical protein
MDRRTDGQMDGWTDRRMDGQMDGGQTDGWMDRQTDRWMDRRKDGQTVGQTNRMYRGQQHQGTITYERHKRIGFGYTLQDGSVGAIFVPVLLLNPICGFEKLNRTALLR